MSSTIHELVQAVTERGTHGSRAAGQLITLLQDAPERFPEFLSGIGSLPEPEWILGITGAPGVGKSTFVSALVDQVRRQNPDGAVGIIAVDPSSHLTGGSLLGDRIRMMQHAADPGVFIRSLASRGHLGGLTNGLVAAVSVLRLLGCGHIIVETIGVGQTETEIADVADHVTVVLAPGQGDSIQLLKSGVMEIADFIVVNKYDLPDAADFVARVERSLHLRNAHDGARQIKVLPVSSLEAGGVDAVAEHLRTEVTARGNLWRSKRDRAIRLELSRLVLDRVSAAVRTWATDSPLLETSLEQLRSGECSLAEAADRLLGEIVSSESGVPLTARKE